MTERAADATGPDDAATRAARARRELWIWLTPVLLALALLSLAGASRAWAPRGWMPEPLLGLVLLGGALAGALHRPFGGASLALGAVIVYPGFEHLGIVPVAVLVPFALAGAELLQRWIEAHRDLPLPERRSLSRLAGWVAIAELSVLAAGATFLLLPDRFALAAMVSALVWLAIPAAYELIIRRSVRRESALDFLRSQAPLLYDLAGLVLGALVVVVAGGAGWVTAWVVLGAFALLAGEAARNGLAAAGHVRRLDEAHRLRRAGAALAEGRRRHSRGRRAGARRMRGPPAVLLVPARARGSRPGAGELVGGGRWRARAGGTRATTGAAGSPRHSPARGVEGRRTRAGRAAADRLGPPLVRPAADRAAGARAASTASCRRWPHRCAKRSSNGLPKSTG